MKGQRADATPLFLALEELGDSKPAEFTLAECTLETKIRMERTADECRLLSENRKYREIADEHAKKVAKLAVTYQKADKRAFDVMEKNRECAKQVGKYIESMMSRKAYRKAISNGLEEEETENTNHIKKDLDEIVACIENMQKNTGELCELARLMAAEVAMEHAELEESVKKVEEMIGKDDEKEGARTKVAILCLLAAPLTGGASLIGTGLFAAGAEVAKRDGLQGRRSSEYLVNMQHQLEEVCICLGGRCEEYLGIAKKLHILKDSLDRGAKIQISDSKDLMTLAGRTTGKLEAITDSYSDVLCQQDDSSRLKAIQDDCQARDDRNIATSASQPSSTVIIEEVT